MASRTKNQDWEEDLELRDDLKRHVQRNLKQQEILDLVKVQYPMYTWSLRTLSRRLQHFGIKFIDYEIDVKEVKRAVEKEMDGPGRLLGYRALHKKIRELHGLNVPRNLVYSVMADVHPEGLEERGIGQPKRARRKAAFTSSGSDFTMSLDGHDKLCGFQNSTFPLCVYGGQDTFSGRINFLRIWTTNNDPKIIGKFYFDYLYESRVLPSRIRVDRGTETGILATIQCYLHAEHGDLEDATESVLYGPSTENKIERWWKELLERMERYFKSQLSTLLEDGVYDPQDEKDRKLLAYVFVPVIQKQLDIFRETVWNMHRVRKQKNKLLPTGVPEYIYLCPSKYGGEKCGHPITEEQLKDVAEFSGVLDDSDDFLDEAFRQECQRHISNTDEIEAAQASNAYLFLRDHFDVNKLMSV